MELLVAQKIAEPRQFLSDCYKQHEEAVIRRGQLLYCQDGTYGDDSPILIAAGESMEKLRAMSAETAAVASACREKIAQLLVQKP